MLSLSNLKQQALRDPHYHGMGIVRLTLNDQSRYNFYSDQIKRRVGFIHDHRFSFTSTIIKGVFRNTLYDLIESDNSEHRLVSNDCKQGSDIIIIADNITPKVICSFDTAEGQKYTIDHQTFHTVDALTSKVITKIDMGPRQKDLARFVLPQAEEWVCAFSHQKSAEECWALIEDILQ